MFSEEAGIQAELKAKREREREKKGLELGDTSSRVKKYDRLLKKNRVKYLQDKKLRRYLKTSDSVAQHAARKAARSELLLQEEPGYLEAEGLEKTHKFKQKDIAAAVPLGSSQQLFELNLDKFGPYSLNYSLNGRYILIGGHKGHLATFDWRRKELGCEFHVHQTVRDVQYLHNEMMFAVAQKRYVYIYDHTGMELHCLKQQREVHRMTFLPYHFILVSADDHGSLHYLDTSIGRPITSHRTQMGPLHCMTQNPYNAIIHLGHHNGTVTLWSPNTRAPLVKLQCHRGPLTDIAVEQGGWAMVTVGMDARMKIWDIRSTYKELFDYHTYRPAVSVSLSQRGLVGIGRGRVVEVWQNLVTKGAERQTSPYLSHKVGGDVNRVEFCPFEDCLGIGHANGFSSIIVPGSGEANFDALEANPFQSKKQRQEDEVKKLLEKISPRSTPKERRTTKKKKKGPPSAWVKTVEGRMKRKSRGRSTLTKNIKKRQKQKEDKGKEARRQQLEEGKKEDDESSGDVIRAKHVHVLDRFKL